MAEDPFDEAQHRPFNLQRFVDAPAGGLYEQALAEIRLGQKRTHWMWFIFRSIATWDGARRRSSTACQARPFDKLRTGIGAGLSRTFAAWAAISGERRGGSCVDGEGLLRRCSGQAEPGGDLRRAGRDEVQVFGSCFIDRLICLITLSASACRCDARFALYLSYSRSACALASDIATRPPVRSTTRPSELSC